MAIASQYDLYIHILKYVQFKKIIEKFEIQSDELGISGDEEKDEIVEIIVILGEARRVARLLESDRKITIPQTTRFLGELYDTMMMLQGVPVSGINEE